MAIALEQTVTGLDAGSSITLTSWTPAANELVLLFVAQRNEALVPSVSGNGLTWVSVATVDGNQGQNGLAVFRAMGSSPTTGSISVTNVSGFDVAVACRFSGADTSGTNGSGAIDASATTAGPAVDDNDMKLQMEMRKFNIATRKNDSATAMSAAQNMRILQQQQETIKQQQAQLAETIRANQARERLQGQQIAAKSGTSGLRGMQYAAKSRAEAIKLARGEVDGKIKASGMPVKPEDYDRMINQALKAPKVLVRP